MGLLDETGRISDPYRNFIHVSRYARWRDEDNRRETWVETVDRYINFMTGHLKEHMGYEPPVEEVQMVRSYILEHKALPSMRALMTAGPALERNNIAGYNCSYVVMDDPVAFDETLYILMNGTGVGFSAERQYSSKLPFVPASFDIRPSHVIVVEDSKEGWAYAYRELIECLYNGFIPSWDTSQVRPAGSRLKTFGGRASGPEPLEDLFRFTTKMFLAAGGRKLEPLEVHDIVCKIAEVVVVGGVRRSALISLGDLFDDKMRDAKHGDWWVDNVQRRLANNSAVYEGKPERSVFDAEWQSLIDSQSGERGIFNRVAARKQAARNGRRVSDIDFGTNPCSEIILRPNEFCNLSTVVVRAEDELEDLVDKVTVATILGTWQATLTRFQYIRDIWRENTERGAPPWRVHDRSIRK
jgi:ribonucleoside-triphosphate reductase